MCFGVAAAALIQLYRKLSLHTHTLCTTTYNQTRRKSGKRGAHTHITEFADVHNIFIATSITCFRFRWINNVNDVCVHTTKPVDPFVVECEAFRCDGNYLGLVFHSSSPSIFPFIPIFTHTRAHTLSRALISRFSPSFFSHSKHRICINFPHTQKDRSTSIDVFVLCVLTWLLLRCVLWNSHPEIDFRKWERTRRSKRQIDGRYTAITDQITLDIYSK